jgi:hypothetical protein
MIWRNKVFYIRVSRKYASKYCSGGRIWVGEEDIPTYVSKKDRKAFATKEEAKAAIVDYGVEIVIEEEDE